VPNWDEDSPELRANLALVLQEIHEAAKRRKPPTLEDARHWQNTFMKGLQVPDARFVGKFRGERGLKNIQVRVKSIFGVQSSEVSEALKRFETKLQLLVAELDAVLPSGQEPDTDQLAAIIDLCAWAHAEWVRIHPFANGNGRTARLWANSLAMRYGLPPFIRLRPRPNTGYAEAGAKAMHGEWQPMAVVFRRLLTSFFRKAD
jgi:Fic family protein